MSGVTCFDGCGRDTVGYSAYCATCAEQYRAATRQPRQRPVYSQSHPFRVGQQVRVERDEVRYPPRGSWPQYRGRVGTVVELNPTPGKTAPPEIGVAFGSRANPRDAPRVWFQPHELTLIGMGGRAAERKSDGPNLAPVGEAVGGTASGPEAGARGPEPTGGLW